MGETWLPTPTHRQRVPRQCELGVAAHPALRRYLGTLHLRLPVQAALSPATIRGIANGIPDVAVNGYANFKGPTFSLFSPSTDIQVADTATYVHGQHVIKAGFAVIRDRVDQNGRSACYRQRDLPDLGKHQYHRQRRGRHAAREFLQLQRSQLRSGRLLPLLAARRLRSGQLESHAAAQLRDRPALGKPGPHLYPGQQHDELRARAVRSRPRRCRSTPREPWWPTSATPTTVWSCAGQWRAAGSAGTRARQHHIILPVDSRPARHAGSTTARMSSCRASASPMP